MSPLSMLGPVYIKSCNASVILEIQVRVDIGRRHGTAFLHSDAALAGCQGSCMRHTVRVSRTAHPVRRPLLNRTPQYQYSFGEEKVSAVLAPARAMYYTNPIRSTTGPPCMPPATRFSSTFRTPSKSTSSYATSSSPTRSTTRSSTPPQASGATASGARTRGRVQLRGHRGRARQAVPPALALDIAGHRGHLRVRLHHTAGYRPSGATWKGDIGRWRDKRVSVIGAMGAVAVVTALAPHVSEAGEVRARADVAVAA
ncbi:hypothetical protein LXA43DRAFT_990328, partial [Ganoderma leucocontextum]